MLGSVDDVLKYGDRAKAGKEVFDDQAAERWKAVEISYEELKNGKAHEKIKELRMKFLFIFLSTICWTKNMQ